MNAVRNVKLPSLNSKKNWISKQEGVLGARMTGAGFGGCAIALVNKDKVEAFKEAVGKRYEEVVGYAPSFYIAEVAAGTRVLD